jgi:hypothetical protein
MNNTTTLGGPASLAFRDFTVPSTLLSEMTVTLTEGTRERTTLGGTFNKGSGIFEEAQATATMYVPSMDWLGANFVRSRYTAPTDPETSGGNMVFGSNSCSATIDAGPLNIHFECEDNDNNDVFFYNAVLQINFELNYTADEDLTVELTFFANPDEDGNIARLGSGDVTQESIWDAETEQTVPVTS